MSECFRAEEFRVHCSIDFMTLEECSFFVNCLRDTLVFSDILLAATLDTNVSELQWDINTHKHTTGISSLVHNIDLNRARGTK